MALNLQILKTRSLTAAVFVLVMLGGLFINGRCFVFLFIVVHFGCWYEFIKLMKKIYGKADARILWGLAYFTIPIYLLLKLGISSYRNDLSITNYSYVYSYLFPCAIIFSIWINDTMAYIVGSLIGKTPFSKISPKKTWEGTAGGGLLCIIVIALLGYYIPVAKVIAVKDWIAIATICATFGTLGDLLESKLKRMANVKDSGSIMPGHGGFLDRFDSLLIATPVVWLYIYCFL
jgi:phosphatidate cytidylyltransferase